RRLVSTAKSCATSFLSSNTTTSPASAATSPTSPEPDMAISLASISKTTRNSLPPRVVVHGDGGVGKSTFAAGAYKPIFLPFEDGLSGLEVDAFPLLRSYQDAIDALASLASGEHGYGTAVVDSLDWFEPLVWEKVCKDHGKKSIEEIPYGKGYAEALPLWRTFLDGLNHLRET